MNGKAKASGTVVTKQPPPPKKGVVVKKEAPAAAAAKKPPAAKKRQNVTVKSADYDPPNAIAGMLETKFLLELLKFLKNFNTKVNFVLTRAGIQITFMESCRVGLIDVMLLSGGMIRWSWTLNDKIRQDMEVGICIESLLKLVAHGFATKHKYIRLVFNIGKREGHDCVDNVSVLFFVLSKKTGLPIINKDEEAEGYMLKVLDIQSERLEVPADFKPDVYVRILSGEFKTLIKDWLTMTDMLTIGFDYQTAVKEEEEQQQQEGSDDEEQDEENLDKKTKRFKKEIHGKDAKKVAALNQEEDEEHHEQQQNGGAPLRLKHLVFQMDDQGMIGKGKRRYKLHNEGDVDEDGEEDDEAEKEGEAAAWNRCNMVFRRRLQVLEADSDDDERRPPGLDPNLEVDIEEDMEHLIMSKAAEEISKLTGGAIGGKRKKSASEAKETQAGTGVVLQSKRHTKPLEPTSYPLKMLAFASLGGSMSDHVVLEYAENAPITIRYDMDKGLGSVKCYIAPKIRNDD
jgi:hypothetical protein